MNDVRNIIFDWSGTLVDDIGFVYQAINKVFSEYGKPTFSREEFKKKFFLPFSEFCQKYIPGVSLKNVGEISLGQYKELHSEISLLPHVVEILKYCKAHDIKVFLLSSIQPDYYKHSVEVLGLEPYFDEAYVGVDDKKKKILELIETHQLNPENTLFVGDMKHDMEAAHHGKVKACAVLTGYESLEQLKLAYPDFVFRDLAGLLAYLERKDEDSKEIPVSTVGALIENPEGKLLMVRTHKWSDCWGIPGGKIKFKETALQALHREIREETGLEMTDVEFVMYDDCIFPKEFIRPAHFLLLNYKAKTNSSDVVLNEEADEYRWVSLAEALTLSLNEPTFRLLDKIYHMKEV